MSSEDLTKRKAGLSEAKRTLLQKRLRGKALGDKADGGIKRQAQQGPLPLSYTQLRVWFLQQLYPGNRAYSMSEAWRLRGPLDTKSLEHALQKVVHRHSSLRTGIVAPESEPLQLVDGNIDLPLSVTDISNLPPVERKDAVRQLVLEAGNYAFELDRAPLIRPSLIRLGSEDHILHLVLHHIVTDEWSNDIIWRELSYYYKNALESGSGELPKSAIQYNDYARWQRDQIESGRLDQQMRYWQDQLGGDLPVLQLPVDRPRPSEQSLRGGIVRRLLPAELLLGVNALGRQEKTTLYTTLLAAFQTLLYLYSRQKDILVGTPIANRQRPETENVVGMFINTVVMRAEVSGDMTFRQLMSQVSQTFLEALANQDLPFDLLVRAIHPDRDLSFNPLFQSMFVFRSDRVERTLPGLSCEPIQVDRGFSKFDLTLFAGEDEGRLVSAFEYSSDLFDETTAWRMLDHWQSLLEAIVEDADAPIDSLPIISSAEQELILGTWNDTAILLPERGCIHELISEHAVLNPNAEAVISVEERLTYGELDARANQLAHRLIEEGAAPGTPVGLYVERSTDMLVGILGILKAGAAYVPLEPSYPAERILFTLQDSNTPLIVTQSDLKASLPLTEATVFVLDADQVDWSEWPTSAPQISVTLDDLAYIIYTSGSTGTPKGVMVTQRNLLASTMARKVYYEKPVRRFLLLSSFAFDSSVAGIFWTLASGGALVLPEPDDEKDVQKLASLVADEQVTHTLALPTLYRLLLAYAPPGRLDSLKVVIVAGEACPPDLGEKHYALLPGSELYNEYGPTEATVWCSVYRLPMESDSGAVPIGRPIANSRLYILDGRQQPVPIGVPGELYVGGEGVTPGYWQDPEMTAQMFPMLDLVEQAQHDRVYRTGDLARWRADGEIEYVGRVDNQVKLRGFRIEMGEIESLLLRHADVEEAVATVFERQGSSGSTDRILMAYVTGDRFKQGTNGEGARLRAFLRERLPEYMVPSQVVWLSTMPHTPNGKADRTRLPKPQVERDGNRPFVAPRSAPEKILARIWSETLRVSQVSVEEKFFELGGDSLMSIQVIARARQEGLVLTPRQLFQEQTIARLAAVASQAGQMPASSTETSGVVSLTPIQHWFFAQRLTQPAHWNQAAWFETAVALNLETLQHALADLVAHHPMLRARFQQVDGHLQEVVDEVPFVDIEIITLAGLDPSAQDEALLINANRLHAGLDLGRGPLLRGAWFNLGADRLPRLLLTIHHLSVDAVSWGILTSDLVTAYTQIAKGEPLSLPSSVTSYARWAEAQARLAQGRVMRQEANYWQEEARQVTPLPRDRVSGESNTEGEADLVTVALDITHTEQLLRESHKAYNTRVDDILLVALARAVGEWSGSRTLLLTLERHGREDIDPQLDVSRTLGWFTSLFPVTLTLPVDRDERMAIRAVKEQLRAVPQNGIGYGMLRYLGDEDTRRQLEAKPQPEILFNYLGVKRHTENEAIPIRPLTENTGQVYGPQNTRVHLIDVNALVENGRLTARWQFAPAYFQKATIMKVAQAFTNEVARLVDHCMDVEQGQHTPSDFPLANLKQDDLDSLSDLLAELE